MTEQDWLTSDDPAALLRGLEDLVLIGPQGKDGISPVLGTRKPSDRKLRLYGAVVLRLRDAQPRTRELSEAVVAFADGGALADLRRVWRDVDRRQAAQMPERALEWCRVLVATKKAHAPLTGYRAEVAAQLLREIFGNPFRPVTPPVERFPSRWHGREYAVRQPWLTPTVVRLATSAYEARDFAALPILADALEDAGCTSEPLLRHLRGWRPCYYCADNPAIDQAADEWCTYCGHERWLTGDFGPGPHVLGCWALDLVLGKE